jgi:hypothetical protein
MLGSPSKSLGAIGGNQREQDREKARKKAASHQKQPPKSATSLAQQRER